MNDTAMNAAIFTNRNKAVSAAHTLADETGSSVAVEWHPADRTFSLSAGGMVGDYVAIPAADKAITDAYDAANEAQERRLRQPLTARERGEAQAKADAYDRIAADAH